MKARRRARALALQALYEIDSVGHPPEVVLEERLAETPLPEQAAEFSRHLVFGVLRYRPVLDRFIQEHAPEWPVEQMACIDRNILRMALFEFAVDGSTPVKVAINEAVELAKMFGSDSSSRFVNGVLGALVSRKDAIARAVQEIDQS
ncbi:MAG TPA: transcription antitermination factor NusB [Chloroflexi bacterium]|nr:transcription antitermination factor NusB [Chloroflexota bacterium]